MTIASEADLAGMRGAGRAGRAVASGAAALLLVAMLAAPAAARAQGAAAERDAPPPPAHHRRHLAPEEVSAWVGVASHSAFKTRVGTPSYRSFYLTAVRATWPLGRADGAVSYFVDLVPLAVSTGMPDYAPDDDCIPGELCPTAQGTPHTAYAAGLSPLGIAVRLAGGRRVSLSLEGSGGGLWFTRAVPDPNAARFNFTAAAGASLEIAVSRERALRIAYLFHHTSNGGRAIVNPGLNSHVISLGLAWRRR